VLKILDGRPFWLDSEGARPFHKRAKVPVVMIGREHSPICFKEKGPLNLWKDRFISLRIVSNVCNLREERLVATFYGCIRRRLSRIIDSHNIDMKIAYNECIGRIFFIPNSPANTYFEQDGLFLSESGEMGVMQKKELVDKENFYPFFNFIDIDEESLGGNELSLFSLAIVPLRKREEEPSTNLYPNDLYLILREDDGRQPTHVTAFIKETAVLTVWRSKSNHARDYAVWPIAIKAVQGIFKSPGIKKPHSTSNGRAARKRMQQENGCALLTRNGFLAAQSLACWGQALWCSS
jgi:hypothetical protein